MPSQQPFDSPYDISGTDYQPEDPDLSDVLAEHARGLGLRLRVAMPARITAVTGDQVVEVQPLYQVAYLNGTPNAPLPIVRGVPVLMPRGQGYSLRLPLTVGDTGLCLFCDRSLDAWMASDGSTPVDPQDGRAHSLNDAIFVPGLVPTSGQTQEGGNTDLVLKAGTMAVRMQQAGRIKVGTSQAELLDLVDQTLTQAVSLSGNVSGAVAQTVAGFNAVATASLTGTSAGGPVAFATPFATALAPSLTALGNLQTTTTQLQTTLQQIQTTLESIKGV